ncbi:MAG: homocysteine S-methyltransferase family protein [Planktomarina sp.]
MIILDGGLGQELVKRAGQATGLWSLQATLEAPEQISAVHTDYLKAGADVVTTNTYSLLPDRLKAYGIEDSLMSLTARVCGLAAKARDDHGSGLIAGSMGPLGFSYQPDKAPPSDVAAEVYAMLAKMHADYVDVHILETMSSVDQAKGGLMGASVPGKPVWVSLSVDDWDGTKLRSGEPVEDALDILRDFKPEVVSVNCSRPEAVTQAMPILKSNDWKLGAYANGFTKIVDEFSEVGASVDMLESRKDLGPQDYLDHAKNWADAGADVIGGCCEVGPDHIRVLADHFKT